MRALLLTLRLVAAAFGQPEHRGQRRPRKALLGATDDSESTPLCLSETTAHRRLRWCVGLRPLEWDLKAPSRTGPILRVSSSSATTHGPGLDAGACVSEQAPCKRASGISIEMRPLGQSNTCAVIMARATACPSWPERS